MRSFEKQPKHAIRKLTVGVCSTVIAVSFLMAGSVSANVDDSLADGAPTVELGVLEDSSGAVEENSELTPESASTRSSDEGVTGAVEEISADRLTVSGEDDVYEATYGAGLDKLTDGRLDTVTELKYDIDANRRLPADVSLPQEVTFTVTNDDSVELESIHIHKRANANGTLTKYSIEAFSGDDSVYESGPIITDFTEELAVHILPQPLTVNKFIITFLEAKNTVDGTIDLQKLTIKEIEAYAVGNRQIDHERFSVSGNDSAYESTYGSPFEHMVDGRSDTSAELKWDYGSNRVLPEAVSLPQEVTLSLDAPTVLNKLEIYKRINANGTLTKYSVEAFNGDVSVYQSDTVNTAFSEELATHDLGNVEADRLVVTFLEAQNTVDGAPDLRKLTLRELKLYEFKVVEEETPSESVEDPAPEVLETPEVPEVPEETSDDPFVKPAAAVGAIIGFTFENDRATITFETGETAQLDLYNNHVFRYNIEKPGSEFVDTPVPSREDRPADIIIKTLSDYKAKYQNVGRMSENDTTYTITTDKIQLVFDKATARMSIFDKDDRLITKEVLPVQITDSSATQTFTQAADEYFFGGGMQNGRFSHKGNKINIVNENNWVDGGVASPNPFYWSTRGYGVLRHTFRPGQYDFGSETKSEITTTHNESRYDAYFFVNTTPANILKDYYELTGSPAVLPEYALYLGHLNAYNRDYWVEVPEGTRNAILLDGKYYREYQPNQLPEADRERAVRETLNGEGDSYKFSAHAVIERYKNLDMPLAWFLPNDGYGAGYGQEDTLDGNIENLRRFVEFANQNGIEVGLWTQSDLYDTDPSKAVVLHRDIDKEVADAGIRAIKTDVAWVGPGYSFGLNGVTRGAALLTEKSGENTRPFIVSLDGWGGTQRAAAIWSGDQVGGQWEYIRFHIPTYIGQGLSGNPNIGSDMDGIFGGADPIINARDYQWKTFTSILMNMDGWGAKPKTPFSFDDRITDLNRIALKLKSTLMPYAYSTGHQANDTGKPIVRAMFIDFPADGINYTKAVQYQYMYGDNLLVAPVYQDTAMDSDGNDIRNNIYLPEGAEWIDFFTGEKYAGGQVLNSFDAPLWKIPVFVKNGAIIPMTNANNNPSKIDRTNRLIQFFPHLESDFLLYEDDGVSEGYKDGAIATTLIKSVAGNSNETSTVVLSIAKTEGDFDGFVKEKTTELHVNVSEDVESVTVRMGDRDLELRRVDTLEAYESGTNVYFYHTNPTMETYNPNSEAIQNLTVTMNDLLKIKLEKTDVTQSDIEVTITGFTNKAEEKEVPEGLEVPDIPTNVETPENFVTATSLKVTWTEVDGAEAYDILHNDVLYTNVKTTEFIFEDLNHGSTHAFKVRSVNAAGASDWSDVLTSQTSEDPWLNAIDIDPANVTTNIRQQPGEVIGNLFNKRTGDLFHSRWGEQVAKDSYIRVDLGGIYELDYLEYLQRGDGGVNGRVQRVTFWTSEDGTNWTPSGGEDWRGEGISKKHALNTKARYVHMRIDGSHGGFISGQELLIFKKPGTRMAIPGDINNDGQITEDDKTSFLNYTGLRDVDSDFDYIRHVDVNRNGLIDAQDINVIATQLEGGVTNPQTVAPTGRVYLTADKLELKAGETAVVTLMADELANVNALTSTFRLDATKLTVVGNQVTPVTAFTKEAENFSSVKTRSGQTDVVFTFVNFGQKELLSGSGKVATVTLRANEDLTLDFSSNDGVLVGNNQAVKAVENLPVRQEVDYKELPATPTNLLASRPTQGSLTLTWDEDAQALRYIVEREVVAEDGSKSYTEVARVEVPTADIYNLSSETDYRFRVTAVNPLGASEPSEFVTASTLAKDISARVEGVLANAETPSQPGQDITLFVDGDEETQYHSQWHNDKAVPSSLVLDLGESKALDHLVYVPRREAGNGTITSLTLQTSQDGENWSETTPVIRWERSATDKVALLPVGTQAQFVKVNWLTSVGGFVSGQELYVLTQTEEEPTPEPTEEVAEELTFTDDATGVTVTLTAKPSELTHVTLAVEPNIPRYAVSDIIDPDLLDRDLSIFDIHFVDENGEEVAVNKNMLVVLPKDADKEVEAVYYIDPTVEDQSIPFTVLSDTTVSILVDHFSYYTLVYRSVSTEPVEETADYTLIVRTDGEEMQSVFENISYDTFLGHLSTVVEAQLAAGLTQGDTEFSDNNTVILNFSRPEVPTVSESVVEENYPGVIEESVSYDNYTLVVVVDGEELQSSDFKNITFESFLDHLSALTETQLAAGLTQGEVVYGNNGLVTLHFTDPNRPNESDNLKKDAFTLVIKVDGQVAQTLHFEDIIYEEFLNHYSAVIEAYVTKGLTPGHVDFAGNKVTVNFVSQIVPETPVAPSTPDTDSGTSVAPSTPDTDSGTSVDPSIPDTDSGTSVDPSIPDTDSASPVEPSTPNNSELLVSEAQVAAAVGSTKSTATPHTAKTTSKTLPETGDISVAHYGLLGLASLMGGFGLTKRRKDS
ncbi:discoidin domain-containing protein [Streptococcus pluranimalium]